MTDLYKKKCVPHESKSRSFDINEIHKYLKKIDRWDVKNNEKKNFYIEKTFKFNNFIKYDEKLIKAFGDKFSIVQRIKDKLILLFHE